jgi:hypothetical protein
MLKGNGRERGLSFFIVEREGVEVNVFFSASFDMCKEEGKRVSFFCKTFFSLLNGYRRGLGVFFINMLKGDGKGKGLIFSGVGLIHFILTKIN